MTQNIPSQQALFYNSRWTEDMDEVFLSNLCDDARARPWRPEIPTHGLLCAQAILHRKFNVLLQYCEVHDRFLFLKQRYETFTWLIRDKDTAYDINNNIVRTGNQVWDRLFKQNELVKAYYSNGEPQIQKLTLLFGLDDVKEESPSRIVVNISDTVSPNPNSVREYINISDTVSPRRTMVLNANSDDDEVTSPIADYYPTSRRRLFDEESVTGNMPEPPVAQPRVPRRQPREPKFDRGESSCGSSSAWTRLFKP